MEGRKGKKLGEELGEMLKEDVKINKKGEMILEGVKDTVVISKKKKPQHIFSRREQIESFWEDQPFFYDKSKIFWLWNNEEKKWILSDEVDFLNSIQASLGIETINTKTKTQLVEGFKQIGRLHTPEPMKKSWVQFKDKIYNIENEEIFEATPKYFITNPIPHNVGKSENTPTIDKLFEEWVGINYKETLYEIMAYNISLDKFMQRIIALCGGGSNGKGTFIKLNYRFLGEDNCVSSEIKSLSDNIFEAAVLYRKLLCVMGEVSYGDLKNTNQLKKLGGEDRISFQFKGKTPFTDENTATCICLTNSLPQTPDKSLGFYRKWLIIDFPNQFKEINKNLIDEIPEKEFENLALKCLNTLKRIYKTRKFTNEGNFEERIQRYEERSNPVMSFVGECCEEKVGENIPIRDFTNTLNDYLKKKHLRIMSSNQVGKVLREEGFLVGNRKINDISSVVILNLLIKTIKTIRTIKEYNRNDTWKTTEVQGSLDSFNSNSKEILCLEGTSVTVLKENEPFNLEISKGNSYPLSYFGDEPEKIIKILEGDGKIRIN